MALWLAQEPCLTGVPHHTTLTEGPMTQQQTCSNQQTLALQLRALRWGRPLLLLPLLATTCLLGNSSCSLLSKHRALLLCRSQQCQQQHGRVQQEQQQLCHWP